MLKSCYIVEIAEIGDKSIDSATLSTQCVMRRRHCCRLHESILIIVIFLKNTHIYLFLSLGLLQHTDTLHNRKERQCLLTSFKKRSAIVEISAMQKSCNVDLSYHQSLGYNDHCSLLSPIITSQHTA